MGIKKLSKLEQEVINKFSQFIKNDQNKAIQLLNNSESSLSSEAKTHIAALSARGGLIEIFKQFENYIDINLYKYYDSNNVILYDAISSGSKEMVEYLINKGADLKAKNHLGNPILFKAVFTENIEIWEILVNNGIDINTTNKFGTNLLTFAISGGYFDSAIYLFTKGANLQFNRLSAKQVNDFNLGFIEFLSKIIKTSDAEDYPGKLYFNLIYYEGIKKNIIEKYNSEEVENAVNQIESFKDCFYGKTSLSNQETDIYLPKGIEAYRLDNSIECMGQMMVLSETPVST
jgi:ankyrin repeat protein